MDDKFINKVKTADGTEYDVQDKRIEAIYTQAEKEKLARMQEVFTTEEKAKVDAIEEVYTANEKTKLNQLKVITATQEDIGKVVGVNENGELALINAEGSGGGTKLYRHVLVYKTSPYPHEIFLISTKKEPYTYNDIPNIILGHDVLAGRTPTSHNLVHRSYPGRKFIFSIMDTNTLTITYEEIAIDNELEYSDTVTEL